MMEKLTLILFLAISNILISQINFTKNPTNPVLPRTTVFGEWDAIAASDPYVLMINDTLRMWYTGVGWLSTSDTSVHQRIGYAWSIDGINWNKYNDNPVLDYSATSWDNLGVETPCVLIDSLAPVSERYKLWYAGQNQSSGIYDIGYAYSSDGINWNKHPNTVLETGSPSSWENAYLEGPCVLLLNDTLRMWYASADLTGDGSSTDFTGNIGYAWSLDGTNWNKHPNNPIFTSYNSTGWDLASVADPHVIFHDGKFHMWYAGLTTWAAENFKMGYAYSYDGINWTRPVMSPVLSIGSIGKWDDEDASYGCVIYNSETNTYDMWYTGIDSNYPSAVLVDYNYEIGHASAENVLSNGDSKSKENIIFVYPNPTKDIITIRGNSLNEQTFKIINSVGQDITDKITFILIKSDEVILNLNSLEIGFYILITETTANNIYKQY